MLLFAAPLAVALELPAELAGSGMWEIAVHPTEPWLLIGPGPDGEAWSVGIPDGAVAAFDFEPPCRIWYAPSFSPDGTRFTVACSGYDTETGGVWTYDRATRQVLWHRRFGHVV